MKYKWYERPDYESRANELSDGFYEFFKMKKHKVVKEKVKSEIMRRKAISKIEYDHT